jgi:hypothetical protein
MRKALVLLVLAALLGAITGQLYAQHCWYLQGYGPAVWCGDVDEDCEWWVSWCVVTLCDTWSHCCSGAGGYICRPEGYCTEVMSRDCNWLGCWFYDYNCDSGCPYYCAPK